MFNWAEAGEWEVAPLPVETAALLRCPACRGPLARSSGTLGCEACGQSFPVHGEVPVLPHPERSPLTAAEVVAAAQAAPARLSPLARGVARALPSMVVNVASEANFARLADLLAEARPGDGAARVLVVGGRTLGAGMVAFAADPRLELVDTDLTLGPRTRVVADAQHLPFADGSFGGVVIQAVLGAVPDPRAAVAEIHRVLAPGGLVYAEDGFLQQVWAGGRDFARFPPSGHRLLFDRFEELGSGVAVGPGSALARSWEHFLLAFFERRAFRQVARVVARLTASWLKHLDRTLAHRRGALDAASGLYFLGRRAESAVSVAEIAAAYRGLG